MMMIVRIMMMAMMRMMMMAMMEHLQDNSNCHVSTTCDYCNFIFKYHLFIFHLSIIYVQIFHFTNIYKATAVVMGA